MENLLNRTIIIKDELIKIQKEIENLFIKNITNNDNNFNENLDKSLYAILNYIYKTKVNLEIINEEIANIIKFS